MSPSLQIVLYMLCCCTDKDECTDPPSGPCMPGLATCTNTMGSYRCQCIDGYHGSGYACFGKFWQCFLLTPTAIYVVTFLKSSQRRWYLFLSLWQRYRYAKKTNYCQYKKRLIQLSNIANNEHVFYRAIVVFFAQQILTNARAVLTIVARMQVVLTFWVDSAAIVLLDTQGRAHAAQVSFIDSYSGRLLGKWSVFLEDVFGWRRLWTVLVGSGFPVVILFFDTVLSGFRGH